MLPIGSIFFPLKVAPIRIENILKRHSIEKLPKLSLLKLPNFDAASIKCSQYEGHLESS